MQPRLSVQSPTPRSHRPGMSDSRAKPLVGNSRSPEAQMSGWASSRSIIHSEPERGSVTSNAFSRSFLVARCLVSCSCAAPAS
eukprot:scaffold50389_cov69-Phaeocystis_antarctica.AAC.6